MAERCAFTGDQLGEALRDRLVCGIRDTVIQKRLLSEPNPSLDRVLEIARGMEGCK